ncbi:MAG: HAMP domain-containing histidine kinase [Parvularculaceae bacterium]|nr:HAMP domain-containing histidine kinase [Parvularculaceae bacterium]
MAEDVDRETIARPRPRGLKAAGETIGRALFGSLDPGLLDWRRARFSSGDDETAYQQFLVEVEAPKGQIVNLVGIAIYYLFGILDFLTFDSNLAAVLTLRWGVVGPTAAAIVLISFLPRFRKYFMVGTASLLVLGAVSIIAMIGLAPREGAPPYIIGIFAIFILFACLQRLRFEAAAAIYVASFALWSLTVNVISPKGEIEVLSGHFFFAWITVVSMATTYVQEIQSRLLYYRDRQREADAARIKQLLVEATAADRSKSNFLSILSHELRTPLHQILGFAEVMQASPRDAPPESLAQITASAQQMLGRISKMLRYADAAAGTIKFEPEEISAAELVAALTEQMRERLAKSGVTIKTGDVDRAALFIDVSHTLYALSNVVENAVSASARGQSVTVSGRRAAPNAYVIRIEDSGRGMTPAQIENAFKPFSLAQDVRSRATEGTGLGLTLADKIVRDQQGSLTLRSAVGAGTTVDIELPVAERARSAA